MREAALLLLVCLTAGEARAGAWTQAKGHWQIITSFEAMHADATFDALGARDPSKSFDKLYLKSLVEYGWSDGITLFAAPEFVIAKSTQAGVVTQSADSAIEFGTRTRLSRRFGILSLQASYKTAGPSDLTNSAPHDSAEVAEIRLLYGTNFTWRGHSGFFDLEAAKRWLSPPRPGETVLDATMGLWLGPKTMVMLQSFNVIGTGSADPLAGDYRMHKLELSVLRCLSDRWSLQAGAFLSPAGRNSLVEQGVAVSLWLRA